MILIADREVDGMPLGHQFSREIEIAQYAAVMLPARIGKIDDPEVGAHDLSLTFQIGVIAAKEHQRVALGDGCCHYFAYQRPMIAGIDDVLGPALDGSDGAFDERIPVGARRPRYS